MRARLIAAALALMLTAVVADAAVLTPDHVVIVIEENLPTRELAPELAYLNSLLHQGANFTNSDGIDHPSQPNYLALFSGDPQVTGSDAKRNPDGSNPIVNGHKSDPAPAAINYGKAMDDWLRQHIEPYRRWALSHNSLLIITWDEDDDAYTPVKDAAGATVARRYINLIPTIMVGAGVVPGDYSQHIDHYVVLRPIEDFYGLAPLARHDTAATPIIDAVRKP